jgi:hypothetical protein
MGRKRKGQVLQERIDKYLAEYELDELNEANDMAALTQMCQLELNMEQIQEALADMKDLEENSKKVKDLMSSMRDATQSWANLQTELGIARKKRQSESDETPLQYIDNLKKDAKKFIDSRLKVLKCDKCGQPLGKFFFYVNDKGEKGSIESEIKPTEEYKYTVRHECWKCKDGHMAEISNENIVLTQR